MSLLSSIFGNNKKSEKEIKEQSQNKNFEVLKYDGIRARNIKQLPYAIKCFEEALSIKEDIETMLLLASSYIQTGEIEKARNTYDVIIEKEPEKMEYILSAAGICFMQEDYSSMNNLCQKALMLDNKNKSAYYLSAKAEKGLKNYLQAIVMLTKAISEDENFNEAYLLRAEVLWEMHQANEALKDLNTILNKEEDNEEALVLKGEILAVVGNSKEANECMDKVISINPFNEKAYIIKANILLNTKDFDKAIEIYNEAIELSPENAKLYQERGRVKLLMEDKEGSMADLKKSIELNPESENMISGNYNNFSQEHKTGIF